MTMLDRLERFADKVMNTNPDKLVKGGCGCAALVAIVIATLVIAFFYALFHFLMK